jgi:hypothetical protein
MSNLLTDLMELIDDAIGLMPREKMLHIHDRRLTVIGDVHADFETFKLIKKEIEGMAVFLGDYADRGMYPVEIYSEVLRLFVEGKAVLLRGNHESTGVFPHELPYQLRELGHGYEDIYIALQKLWKKMPVSAIVENQLWLVHGGVPTKGCKIDDEGIEFREVAKPDEYATLEMLWNDPWEKQECGENYRRGVMYFFGKKATKCLLEALDVRVVVRAHEPFKVLKVEQDGMVVTLGTSPLPYGLSEAAILKIEVDKGITDGYDLVRKFGYVFSVV